MDQGNPVSHVFYGRLFAVPGQSAKNAKIMRLENLALYGVLFGRGLLCGECICTVYNTCIYMNP